VDEDTGLEVALEAFLHCNDAVFAGRDTCGFKVGSWKKVINCNMISWYEARPTTSLKWVERPMQRSSAIRQEASSAVNAGNPSIQARIQPTRVGGRPQERGDRTRSAIIDATIQCVLDEGFAAASAKRIAERGGVTWGVIQYHFGDRNGILGAVVTRGYETFIAAIEAIAIPADDVEHRIPAIIDTAWAAYSLPAARASLEILIGTRTTRDPRVNTELEAMAKTTLRLGERIVGESSRQRALGQSIGQVLWATLLGLALGQTVTTVPIDSTKERAMLATLVLTYLRQHEDD